MSWAPTDSVIEEMRALAAAGNNDTDLAVHFGVPPTSIEYWRRRAHIGNGYVRPSKKEPPEGFIVIAATLTKMACAKHFGVSTTTARRWYTKTGIVPAQRHYSSQGDKASSPRGRRFWRKSGVPQVAAIPLRDDGLAGRAQFFLQRFGPCFRASVLNSKADGWLLFGRHVSEAELIAIAQRKGFVPFSLAA